VLVVVCYPYFIHSENGTPNGSQLVLRGRARRDIGPQQRELPPQHQHVFLPDRRPLLVWHAVSRFAQAATKSSSRVSLAKWSGSRNLSAPLFALARLPLGHDV
jgi:hypothetical protein